MTSRPPSRNKCVHMNLCFQRIHHTDLLRGAMDLLLVWQCRDWKCDSNELSTIYSAALVAEILMKQIFNVSQQVVSISQWPRQVHRWLITHWNCIINLYTVIQRAMDSLLIMSLYGGFFENVNPTVEPHYKEQEASSL